MTSPEMIAMQITEAAQKVQDAADVFERASSTLVTVLKEHQLVVCEVMREHARALAQNDTMRL